MEMSLLARVMGSKLTLELGEILSQYGIQNDIKFEQWKPKVLDLVKRKLTLEIQRKFVDQITREKVQRGDTAKITIVNIVAGIDLEFKVFVSRYGVCRFDGFWYDRVKVLDLIVVYDDDKLTLQ